MKKIIAILAFALVPSTAVVASSHDINTIVSPDPVVEQTAFTVTTDSTQADGVRARCYREEINMAKFNRTAYVWAIYSPLVDGVASFVAPALNVNDPQDYWCVARVTEFRENKSGSRVRLVYLDDAFFTVTS